MIPHVRSLSKENNLVEAVAATVVTPRGPQRRRTMMLNMGEGHTLLVTESEQDLTDEFLLNELFNNLDTNGDGVLEFDEIKRAVVDADSPRLLTIFQQLDSTKDGVVDIDEFRQLCNTTISNPLHLKDGVFKNEAEIKDWQSALEKMMERELILDANPPPLVTYKQVLSFVFVTVTVLATLERFYLNLTPDGQLPDMPEGLHWSFQAFHFLQRSTARIILCCCGFFFVTMTRVLHNFLSEVIPYSWIDFTNYNRVTFKGHKVVGMYVVVAAIVVHIGGAFLPLIDRPFNLTDEAFYPFYVPFRREVKFPAGGKWNMRIDDLYQGAIGLVLAALMPLTILWPKFRRKYNLSFGLHVAGALVMIWLIYRIPEHIRTFIYLTPPIAMWMIDRVLYMFVYRKRYAQVDSVIHLDEHFHVVCFDLSDEQKDLQVGDQYWFSCPERFGFFDFAHPFTTFTVNVESEDSNDHSGGVVQKKRLCSIVHSFGKSSFTQWLTQTHDKDVQIRGPYRRVYSRLQKQPVVRPLILIATGTGAGYIIDFLNWVNENHIEFYHKVFILFSTNSPALLSYVGELILPVSRTFLQTELHLTSNNLDALHLPKKQRKSEVDVLLGRFNLYEKLDNLPRCSDVYFCGVQAVHDAVRGICSNRGLQFYSEVPYNTRTKADTDKNFTPMAQSPVLMNSLVWGKSALSPSVAEYDFNGTNLFSKQEAKSPLDKVISVEMAEFNNTAPTSPQ